MARRKECIYLLRIARAGGHVALLSTIDGAFASLIKELLEKHDQAFSVEIEECEQKKKPSRVQ